MKLTAIIALSLGLLRFVPATVLTIPIFVFLIVVLELAIVQAFFDRPLRTFYFTFLIVGVALTGTVTYFFFNFSGPVLGSLQNLEAAIQNLRGVRPVGVMRCTTRTLFWPPPTGSSLVCFASSRPGPPACWHRGGWADIACVNINGFNAFLSVYVGHSSVWVFSFASCSWPFTSCRYSC